jgi:endoglucanase
MTINFLRSVALIMALALTTVAWAKSSSLPGWSQWRSQYVDDQGRVIDAGQNNTSHSEGQGFGLLLAADAGDRATFERIWGWTHKHLQIRGDNLFAWQWNAKTNQVTDRNDASDEDMLIAL